MTENKPWTQSMPEEQFEFMRDVLGAPSPVGFEGAMTFGVLEPYFNTHKLGDWKVTRFQGNASIVLDSAPEASDALTVMVVGHADKIRLQVRSIGDDGKIWINSDSFLPQTLLGHEVLLFSEDPKAPGKYRVIEGGTVEALGAIHFASDAIRKGSAGIKKEMLYLELQIHGPDKRGQVERLGIKPGDPLILNRKIKRGFSPDTFYGAYLDNGLGSFVAAEVAREVAKRGGLKNIRLLATAASHEEIGRMGSRVIAGELRPDVVIAVDVNHDYVAAPGIKDKRFNPLSMGGGFTLSSGSITSEHLNAIITQAALDHDIPMQRDVRGRDTGTDGMAAVLAGVDAAATSIGFPIRNMHTISETGHTGDVLASIAVITEAIFAMDSANGGKGLTSEDFKAGHARLDNATPLQHIPGDE